MHKRIWSVLILGAFLGLFGGWTVIGILLFLAVLHTYLTMLMRG